MASVSTSSEKQIRLGEQGTLGSLMQEIGADIPIFSDGEIVRLGLDTQYKQLDDDYAVVTCQSADSRLKNEKIRRKCAHYVVTRMAQQIGMNGEGLYKLSKKNDHGKTFWVVEKVKQ